MGSRDHLSHGTLTKVDNISRIKSPSGPVESFAANVIDDFAGDR